MSSYAILAVRHKLNITKNITENKTNTIIEMTTNSEFFQNLFLTKKEKENKTIYEIIMTFIAITTFVASFYIQQLILGNKSSISEGISISGGCLIAFIWVMILSAVIPILNFFKKKLVTKIKNIKLTFSSRGLEIDSNTKKKQPMLIEALNIKEISIEENQIADDGPDMDSMTKKVFNIILVLHKPITEQFTNKEIEKITIIEEIDKEDFKKAIKLAEEIQEALELKDI